MTREETISGLEKAIQQLDGRTSDYWRGVRDGYKSALKFLRGPKPEQSGYPKDYGTIILKSK